MITIQGIAADIARELRANPKAWTQGALARDEEGWTKPIMSPNATCWCLDGHIDKRLNPLFKAERDSGSPDLHLFGKKVYIGDFVRALKAEFRKKTLGLSIPGFNDAADTNVYDIIKVCDEVAKS